MKKYLVFMGDYYYPSAGLGDLQTTVDTEEEVLDWLRTNPRDASLWTKVYDRDTAREIMGAWDD